MFGASGKSGRGGRGGGGAGGKRKLHSNFHSTSLNRPSGGRSSVGGSSAHRNSRTTTATPATAGGTADPVAADETFSLDTGNPLDFAMIIRLTPDLVDEIKRAESQGGSARIKFDANAYNTTGNVIDVGGKDFRFTWSREMGDLCDIYEERQSGENGNGLLVESGCAWRKLNVQRVLDETTKNQVKMRSEEAERKSKSRKSIILDHGNPSMKSQMKALAAAEANPRKIPFKPAKEPPYKKRKAEPPPGPPKSAQKHESSLTSSKGRFSASPLPSTPEQTHMSLSPFGPSSISRGCTSVDDNMPTQVTNKEKASISEKGTPKRVTATAVLDKPARKGNLVVKPTDLKSMLISLLTDNPRGMSLKALEKSVRENFPNTGRQIEPILKKIATYQAPGRYILNSGAELESLKKPLSESRSAPENNQQQTPGPGNNCDERRNLENSASVKTSTQNNQQQTPDPGDNCDERRNLENSAFVKTPTQNDEPANLNSEPGEVLPEAKKINIPIHSPDHVEKRVCDNSEGLVATSDDSGSDSESDSSDSESESGSQSRGRSRSKSKSPVESRSGSSSDSESDASSSSKEGSDEEVDIMTSDDEKEPENKLQAPEHELSTSPIQQRPGDLLVQNATNAKEDLHASEGIEIAETLPGYNGSLSIKYGENHAQVTKSSSGDWAVPNTSQIPTGGLHGERDNGVMDGFRHEDSDISQRKHEGSSTKGSYEKYLDDRAVRSKNVKAGSVSQAPISENSNFLFSGSPGKCSPGRPIEGPYKAHNIQITGKAAKDRADFGLHQQDNQSNPGKAIYDSQLSSPRHVDITGWTNAPSANDRPSKYPENMGSTVKFTERSLQMPEGLLVQKGEGNRDIRSEDGYNNERRPPKNPREGAVDKNATHTDSQNRKRGELAGKIKEVGPVANSQVVYPSKGSNRSDMEGSPINRRGPILRRDPSDLELGELRGSLPEEVPGFKKQFGRNGSFKQFENKLTSFDYWNPDVSKEAAGRTGVDLVKPSQPNSNGGVVGNSEGLSKKRSPKHHKDSTKSQHKVMQSHPPELPRVNQTEVGSQPTDLADVSTKSAHNEAVPSRGTRLEGYGDTQREVMVVTSQLDEAVQGRLYSTRESKRRKTNTSFDLGDRCKDPPLMASRSGGNKKSGSFSDDNNFSYCKYEKDKPELKGPIKDHSQYKEYVQEFREKYDDYFSINKILESERNEFERYGRDLEAAKGKDMNRYYSILEELKESYNQCGMRHKRLKKVFVVLHEELESLKEMIKEYANSCTKV